MKDDSNRSLRRVNRKSRSAADRTVEVDSSAFFAEDPSPTPLPRKKPGSSAPRRSGAEAQAAAARPSAFGRILLPVQGILSVASLVQLWRTQMLPVLYLVILAALLFLLWLLVKRCQEYNVPGKVSRVFSVFLCACMALGCVWAQQGLTALDNMTNGLLTGAEANKITKEPFVIYLSGVDTRGELTEKARSDVNILAVVNPQTKQVALINTPRDYYVDLAGTNSKDKLTHAGLYGVETSMATLGLSAWWTPWAAWTCIPTRPSPQWAAPATTTPPPLPKAGTIWTVSPPWPLPGSATPLPPAISSAASTR